MKYFIAYGTNQCPLAHRFSKRTDEEALAYLDDFLRARGEEIKSSLGKEISFYHMTREDGKICKKGCKQK